MNKKWSQTTKSKMEQRTTDPSWGQRGAIVTLFENGIIIIISNIVCAPVLYFVHRKVLLFYLPHVIWRRETTRSKKKERKQQLHNDDNNNGSVVPVPKMLPAQLREEGNEPTIVKMDAHVCIYVLACTRSIRRKEEKYLSWNVCVLVPLFMAQRSKRAIGGRKWWCPFSGNIHPCSVSMK